MKFMQKCLRIIKEVLDKGYTMDKGGNFYNPKGKLLKGCVTTNGYIKVGLRILEYQAYALRIHKVQGYLKYGEESCKDDIKVRHLDGIPDNNTWDNIAIGSHSDNMMDIPAEKRIQMASSPKHDHSGILKDHKKGMTYPQIMDKHNISSKGTLSYIIRKSLASVA